MKSSKVITLVVGGVVGAALGVFTAFFLQKQLEKNSEPFKLTSGKGAKVGMGVLNLIRSIFELGRG